MEQLAGMELPCILNEQGEQEEVPLSNPADWVYGLTGSDVLYLTKADLHSISPARISLKEYLSHRRIENRDSTERQFRSEQDLFLSYLYDKMGYLGKPRENSLLSCQLEYIAKGGSCDLENVRAVTEEIFWLRFADNVACALSDGGLWGQAIEAAQELHAVQLKETFMEPVARSILYACAFLESISDVQALYEGKRIPLRKYSHNMSVSYVLGDGFYTAGENTGWKYEQYLGAIILLAGNETINLRAMDIMEMDIRKTPGNAAFRMDACFDSFLAQTSVNSRFGYSYEMTRRYGFY